MDRAFLVNHLRERFAEGGYAALMPMIDAILARGPFHDPEWWVCMDCGQHRERQSNTAGPVPDRCPECAAAHHARRQLISR